MMIKNSMKQIGAAGLALAFIACIPQAAEACAYHGALANLTFGNFVIMVLDHMQVSAQNYMVAAADGLRYGTDLKPLGVALSFGFGYGAVHALGPGHGKIVISSYFLANGGKIKEGVLMGGQIALVHVTSAILIVVAADLILGNIIAAKDANYRVVRLISYAAIAGIGLYMLYGAFNRVVAYVKHRRADAHHHDHDHDHHHGSCGCALHEHDKDGETRTRSFISMLVGVVPCTGAILVMLFALANSVVFVGVLVVLAISLGMAITMASLGILSVVLRRSVLDRVGEGGAIALNFEILGALGITAIGAVLFWFTY